MAVQTEMVIDHTGEEQRVIPSRMGRKFHRAMEISFTFHGHDGLSSTFISFS